MRFLLAGDFMHFPMNEDKQIIIYFIGCIWYNSANFLSLVNAYIHRKIIINYQLVILWMIWRKLKFETS